MLTSGNVQGTKSPAHGNGRRDGLLDAGRGFAVTRSTRRRVQGTRCPAHGNAGRGGLIEAGRGFAVTRGTSRRVQCATCPAHGNVRREGLIEAGRGLPCMLATLAPHAVTICRDAGQLMPVVASSYAVSVGHSFPRARCPIAV